MLAMLMSSFLVPQRNGAAQQALNLPLKGPHHFYQDQVNSWAAALQDVP
jgi:hypothetical protein